MLRLIDLQDIARRIMLVLLACCIGISFGSISASAGKDANSALSINEARQRVHAHVDGENFDEALEVLEPYRKQPGTYPGLYSDYLVILAWAGEPEKALELFDAMPEAVARRPYLLRNMAKACFDLGRYQRAAKLYKEAFQKDPDDRLALEGLLASYVHGNRLEAADKLCDEHAGAVSQNVDLGLLKARILVLQGRYAEAFLFYDELLNIHPEHRMTIIRERDDFIAGLAHDKSDQMVELLGVKAGIPQADARIRQYEILALCLCRKYEAAVNLMDASIPDLTSVPDDRLYRFAWAYFHEDRVEDAESAFDIILSREPDDPREILRARIGRVYCLAAQKDFSRAEEELDYLADACQGKDKALKTEFLYAHAYFYEQQNRFWEAVRVYNRLLETSPGNPTALRLRIRALSDMGATSLAREQAEKTLPNDSGLHESLRRDAAVDQIRFENYDTAASRLLDLADKDTCKACRLDAVAALSRGQRHEEAVDLYGKIAAEQSDMPAWVLQPAGDSYHAIGEPGEALALYNRILEEDPADPEAAMGKFYALQSLRLFGKAHEWLSAMIEYSADNPHVSGEPRPDPGLDAFDLKSIRAWLLAHEGRLGRSQDAFEELHVEAPANMGVRNGLAHVYLWRGWPRRSLEAFNIVESMDEDYLPATTGRIMAIHTLGEKRRAWELVSEAEKEHPRDRNVRQTKRTLKVDRMREWRTEADFMREDDGSRKAQFYTEVSAPVDFNTRMFGFMLWQRSWHDGSGGIDDTTAYFRRAGLGAEHIFNAAWRARSAASVNYDDGKDFGASLRLDYTPTDHLAFGIHGDTFETDIDRRARLADIEASSFGGDAVWRQSEWRQAGLGYTRSLYSDDNIRDEFWLGYEQNLWVRNNWRMRVYLDGYGSWNSRGDETPYFNPEQAREISVTHMTEQILRDDQQRSFLHRFYISAGNYWQKGYGSGLTGSVRYEQEHEFSDRHKLKAGIGFGRSVYDGSSVNDVNMDMVYQWRF